MPLPTSLDSASARAQGYHVRINDLWLRLVMGLDESLIRREKPQARRLDTATNPEDFVPESGLFFSINDFTGGEGLDYTHRPGADSTRYWDSRGVDVSPTTPGQPRAIRLLEALETMSGVTLAGRMDSTSDTLFVAHGDDVAVITTPTGTPSVSLEDPQSGAGAGQTVLDVAVLTDQPYAAIEGVGIRQRTGTNTWAAWSTLDADRVWAIKGRILASVDNALYEAGSVSNDLLLTADATINDVVEAGKFILVAAGHFIHALTFDESSLAITPAARTRMFANEEVVSMAFSPTGLLFIGTGEFNGTGTIGRWYRATVTDAGGVTGLTLIRQWGDCDCADDRSPMAILVTRESAYTGVNESTLGPHLWRYDITTGGRNRAQEIGGSAPITSLAVIGDRLFVSHSNTLYRESSSYVTTGWVITPLYDHHTARSKQWAQITVDVVDVTGAITRVYYSTKRAAINDPNHSSWTLAAAIEGGETSTHNIDAPLSRFLTLKIELEGTTAITPEVLSVSSKAHPSGGDLVLSLPVNVGDVVNVRGHRALKLPGLGRQIYNELYELVDESISVELLDPPLRMRGSIEEVTTPVLRVGSPGSPTMVSRVVIRGSRASTLSLLSGGSLGLFGTDVPFATNPFAEVN